MLKPEFISMLDALANFDGGRAVEGLAEALVASNPSVGIRLNPLKLKDFSIDARPVPWAIDGYYIDGERPRFTLDPAMHQGLYYVQDPSSMIISQIVKQLTVKSNPIVYLDACAAPGGKTTAAIAALPEGSLVVANEFDRRRAEALRENVIKWGYENCVVTRGDTDAFAAMPGFFDIVAVDAPCSGEGMMRKEAVAVEQWSPALVAECATLQSQIIRNCWEALRPGGYMIYSTCTFNRTEDEENLQYIADRLGGEPVAINIPGNCGICGAIGSTLPAMRFIPGRVEGEGLFIGVMRKPGLATPRIVPIRPKEKPLKAKLPATLLDPQSFVYEESADNITAIPRHWHPEISLLRRGANVIYCGIEMATAKGRDLVPSQALAMSRMLNRESIPNIPVDYHTAISYLRGEAIRPEDAPRGFILLTYLDHPLGFAKSVGNRANNLYPSPWAIKTTYTLTDPASLFPTFK